MRKLVLGIIALVSVQFAFVTYMMVLQQPVQLAVAPARTEPRPERPGLAQVIDGNGPDETEESVAAVQPSDASVGAVVTPVGRRTTPPVLKRPAFRPALKSVVPRGAFKTVVIRYNPNPDISSCDPPEVPKAKKRSYLAKSLPVIKRPWEWMKAAGSRLN